jgi:glycosyltransferase involved in cell wall biosynthesis
MSMKVAIVHELLTRRGGAEKVAKVLAEMFPSAPIYTLIYDEAKLGDWFPRERVRTSNVQRATVISTNHHLYLPFFPRAVEAWDFSEFDLVISSSTAFAHGIRTVPKTKHLCYVHSPARYLWDQTNDVLERAGRGFLGTMKRKYLQCAFHALRLWDSEVAFRPDRIIANSRAVQRRIELYWRRESEVIYPPVELSDIALSDRPRENFYVVASTLTPYKRIDLAVEACERLGRRLLIIGEGPAQGKLRKLAKARTEFLGYRPREELIALIARARAFLFPGEDDFGIAPIEAMAAGTPVIAYQGGGVTETIREGVTGEFFSEPTAESLIETMKKFESKSYSAETCREQADNFTRENFEKGVWEAVNALSEAKPRSIVTAPPLVFQSQSARTQVASPSAPAGCA